MSSDGKLKLSPSRIDNLDRCSLQHWYSYEAKIRLKPTGKMSQGQAVDGGVSHNYEKKIVTGVDLPADEVKDFVAQEFERRKEETNFHADEKPDKLKDQAVHLVGVYQSLVAPVVQPIAVQQPLNLDFPDAAYYVQQYADVVEEGTVRDTKVAGRRLDEDAAKSAFQLTLYAIGYESVMGVLPTKIVFDRLIRGAKEKPLQQVESVPTEIDRHGALLKLQSVANRIELMRQDPLKLIYPADPAKPNSPCSWCGYARMCVPAGRPWWKYLMGEEGMELAKSEARRILTEERLARKIEITDKIEPEAATDE